MPKVRRLASADSWVEASIPDNGTDVSVRFSTRNGQWATRRRGIGDLWSGPSAQWDVRQRQLLPMAFLTRSLLAGHDLDDEPERFEPQNGTTKQPTKDDMQEIRRLGLPITPRLSGVFASAPVRSRPRRTYDPTHALQDAAGGHIPMFLSGIARGDQSTWESVRSSLESFGQASGLFDEIAVKTLGGKAGGPFQIQIRKFGKRAKGPRRNIIDVGYGVSQVLPVVTELLRPRGSQMFLLQQPEVHLHPSAQAALGSLFCDVAAKGRQLLVETHSDHLMDRIRMDVRDGRGKLRPKDVSILYFERRNLSVIIYSLGWDANGNLVATDGAIPDGYREFFRLETRRSLGL
ncbi:AAA family ATPase [Candidatus Palauibacter sp.]|uniref:AAA family ATPase n=1 Tax=Candidatus Palauibacter sp. TaxID=3101350 RepID=UPI003B02C0F4